MTPIRVLLADDHTLVLEGLRAVLRTHEEINICGEAQNGEEVIAYLHNNPVDVVVLDINMPVMDGITCARKIKALHPRTKILILTMYAQKSFIDQILKIGVDGCLLKSNTGKELKEAILRVMDGKSYYDLINIFQSDSNEIAQFKLSEREVQIVKLIADGLTSAQIAENLFIADHTVKTHRKNIMKKIGVHSTPQLIQFALNNKIL